MDRVWLRGARVLVGSSQERAASSILRPAAVNWRQVGASWTAQGALLLRSADSLICVRAAR